MTAHLHLCHNKINVWKEVDDRGLAGSRAEDIKIQVVCLQEYDISCQTQEKKNSNES